MKIELALVTDLADGSAIYHFDLSHDAVIAFAQIGLQHALIEAAERAIKEHGEVTQEDAGGGGDDGGEREGIQAGGAQA
jgi:hypothetical protein